MKIFVVCYVTLIAGVFAIPVSLIEKTNENRIVGGNETTIEEHPYQISLKFFGDHICGGAVITAHVALTASHCLEYPEYPSWYSVMAGATMVVDDEAEQIRELVRLLPHPLFTSKPPTNDVGLLFWEEPLVFGANIQPILLQQQADSAPYGSEANVTGWGIVEEGKDKPISERLRVVSVPLISNEECRELYGDAIVDVMLCAGVPEGGRDACQGYSGSALVIDNVQLGVVSFGIGCGRENKPGVYARVASFVDWINENILPDENL